MLEGKPIMKQVRQNDVVLGSVKWSDMWDSEEELIEAVRTINLPRYINNNRKGYEVIQSAQRVLVSGRELSKAHVTQLKRLSKEVYRYHNNF